MAPTPPPLQREDSYLTPSLRDVSDAGSIHSEQDSDSEDDSVIRQARTSADIRAHDRNVLFEEDERDRMLTEARRPKSKERRGSGLGLSNPFKKMIGQSKQREYDTLAQGTSDNLGQGSGDAAREKRRRRREEKKERLLMAAEQGEDRGLLYEMEEGEMKDGSNTGDSSDTEGLSNDEKAHLHDDEYIGRRKWGWRIWTYIVVLISLFITLLVLGAWRLSIHSRPKKHDFAPPRDGYVSNGTALFLPTTLLISLDGFRADYLSRGVTPALQKFMNEGVAPEYMNPSFPSVTFPNHYTLITGLYPESHGIVANKFWDPALQKEFKYTDPAKSRDREWWSQAEPLWVTAEKGGIRTAIHMWPGSEASISDIQPSIVDAYKGKQPLDEKLRRLFDMLDMPGAEDIKTAVEKQRPQFIASYVPNIDSVGHRFGPNSTDITESLGKVDAMLGDLFKGIEERNLTDIVNIVIVSDHGMAESSNDRLIEMDKIIDMNLVEHVDGWPLYGIRPKEPVANNVLKLHKVLMMAAVEHRHSFDIYMRDGDGPNRMPDRWHFKNNERIAPLWVVPKVGWAIVTKDEFDVEDAKKTGKQYTPKGIHGYDNEDPMMRAIFAARGPAFKDLAGKHVEPFQNTEVYNIVCDSLYLTPRPNNGTMNLFRQPLEAPVVAAPLGVPSLSGSAPVSSVMSSASTEVAASSTPTADNPLKKPPVSISSALAVSSMSSALESASSAVVDRPVISETPAAVVGSLTTDAVVSAPETPVASKPAAAGPVDDAEEDQEGEADDGGDDEYVGFPADDSSTEEEGEDSSGGWWNYIKGKIGDAKDWVVGLLPGDASSDENSENSD